MRILDLTTDCLLLVVNRPDHHIVHCQSGPAVMHSGCPKQPPRFRYLRLMRELLRGRRYDWVIFPPIHVEWTVSNGKWRKWTKRLLTWMIPRPLLFRIGMILFFGRNTRFAVTDYADRFEPSRFALHCIRPDHYFMLNVPRDLVGTKMGPAGTRIHYLPTVIPDKLIDSLGNRHGARRSHDIFIAGDFHNPNRLKQLEASRILEQRGHKIFKLEERSFEKFITGILDSKLCMAARGVAYHCFRPLEAAAAGAAPIFHTPEKDTYHDYVHGGNCFLHPPESTPDEIADFVESILARPDEIARVAQGALSLLNQKHRASALADHILGILGNTRT